MNANNAVFRLTLDSPVDSGAGVSAEAAQEYVLPPHPSSLVRRGAGGPELLPHVSSPGTDVIAFEPLPQRPSGSRLLALTASDALRLNGQPAPQLVVLKANDFVQWGADVAFHVDVVRRSVIGYPPPEWIGRPCPVCRVAFGSTDRTLACTCGALVHCEEREDKLQCAQLRRACPACQKPFTLLAAAVASPA